MLPPISNPPYLPRTGKKAPALWFIFSGGFPTRQAGKPGFSADKGIKVKAKRIERANCAAVAHSHET